MVMNMSYNMSEVEIVDGGHMGSELQEHCLLYVFIIHTVFIGFLCITGVIGNVVAFTVFQMDTLKTSTTFLFQGLSLTDTFLLITAFPLYCIDALVNYTEMSPYYQLHVVAYVHVYVYPFCMTAQTTTVWVTVLVAVNRYIAVCKPYRAARLCSVNKAKKHLLLVIVLSVLFNVPRFFSSYIKNIYESSHTDFLSNSTMFDNGTYNGTMMNNNNSSLVLEQNGKFTGNDGRRINMRLPEFVDFAKHPYYDVIYNNVLYTIIMLVIPLLTLTVLNILLIVTLNNIKRKRAVMQTRAQQQDNNVTFVLIIVVVVFIVCQMPALVNQIMWSSLPNKNRQCGRFQYYFRHVCNLLVILNSAVNFVIYFLFNSRFKQVVVGMMCTRDAQIDRSKKWACTNGTQCSQTLLTSLRAGNDGEPSNRYQNGQTQYETNFYKATVVQHPPIEPGNP